MAGTLFSAEEGEGSAPFEILHPVNETFFTESFMTVSVDMKGMAFDRIEILTDGNISIELPREEKEVYCASIPLKLGESNITVAAYLKEKKIAEESRDVFHMDEVFEGYEEAPYYFMKNVFHTDENEKRCAKCHSFSQATAAVEADAESEGATIEIQGKPVFVPEDPKAVSCYQCHNRLVSRKNSHAPAVNMLCGACHTGGNGEYNAEDMEAVSRFAAPDPIMETCFSCHDTAKAIWFNHKSEHGPAKFGRCHLCHNPHSSDNEFFLRKPIWTLCTTCHAEKASGRHVVMGFSSQNFHPTRGKPDPARPGRELVCSGCHNPHGSQKRKLLRSPKSGRGMVCLRCHQK